MPGLDGLQLDGHFSGCLDISSYKIKSKYQPWLKSNAYEILLSNQVCCNNAPEG